MPNKREYKRDKRSPIAKSETVSKVMSSIKGTGTKLEISLRKALYNSGVRGYRINYKKLPGKPDIAFPNKKIVIFIHGCFWHGCKVCGRRIPNHNSDYWANKINKNIARDENKKAELEKMGYMVIELWEHEIKKELENVVKRMLQLLAK